MTTYAWSSISKLHLGKYAEYFVKMECARAGLDVYTSEVDDRGIDFVIRIGSDRYIDVQVKAVRDWTYVFMRKSTFAPRDRLYLALVLLRDGVAPDLYLIPATVWLAPDDLFVSRDYGPGLSSPPEWGMNLSAKRAQRLEEFRFELIVGDLLSTQSPPAPGT